MRGNMAQRIGQMRIIAPSCFNYFVRICVCFIIPFGQYRYRPIELLLITIVTFWQVMLIFFVLIFIHMKYYSTGEAASHATGGRRNLLLHEYLRQSNAHRIQNSKLFLHAACGSLCGDRVK